MVDAVLERIGLTVTPRMRRVSRNVITIPRGDKGESHASYEACE